MAIQRSSFAQIFGYIVNDFEDAWNALAQQESRHSGRGNFMFALLSMILLELACRACAQDERGEALRKLGEALRKTDRRYFTRIPGTCNSAHEFALPGENPDSHLLGMIFDLIRNGKAHQYQSAIVKLSDGDVDMDITGALSGRSLTKPRRRRPGRHLTYKISPDNDLSLYVRTDQLFLDIKKSIEQSGILSQGSTVEDVVRPRARHYNFTVAALEAALRAGGHLPSE